MALTPTLAMAHDPPKATEPKATDPPVSADPGAFVFGKVKDFVLGASYDPAKGTATVLGQTVIINEFTKATLIHQGDVHAGVGDVYKLDFTVEFQRRRKEIQRIFRTSKHTKWEYWYEVYLDGQKAFEDKIGQDPGHSFKGIPGENVTATRSLYLLASGAATGDPSAVTRANVSVRAVMKTVELDYSQPSEWRLDPPGYPKERDSDGNLLSFGKTEFITVDLKPGEVYTPRGSEMFNFKRVPGHHWAMITLRRTSEVLDNWDPVKRTPVPEESQKQVIVHNPWMLDLDAYPREAVHHHDAASTGTMKFHVATRRDFPNANIGNPPKEIVVDSNVTANAHFKFGDRDPKTTDRKSLGDDGKLSLTQKYEFATGEGHHPTQKITFTMNGRIHGKRQLEEGTGPMLEWSAVPRIAGVPASDPAKGFPYSWQIDDIDDDAPPAACGGLVLPKAGAASDVASAGHLAAKSFAFTIGEKGKPGYTRGTITVTPGIRCDDRGNIGFPLFGGVSRQADYFKIETTEGSASAVKYPEQWLSELRITFDRGEAIKSTDALLSGKIPAGAKRVTKIEMDFTAGDSPKTTLTW